MHIPLTLLAVLNAIIISVSLRAMDESVNLINVSLSKINHPSNIAFQKEKIFVAAEQGLCVYNTFTKEVSFLTKDYTFGMAKHLYKPYLALSSEVELAVYNTETETKLWSTSTQRVQKNDSLAFSSVDDALFSYNSELITVFNWQKNDTITRHSVPCDKLNTAALVQISCHPTQKHLVYPSGQKTISIVNLEKTNNHTIFPKKSINSPDSNYISYTQYSPDGNVIGILDDSGQCCIIDLKDNSPQFLKHPNIIYISMTFHPYKKILALLTDDGSVHYWNYETQQLIATTYPYSYGDKKLWSLGSKRLDFSLNEKLIGVAHIDSCCIKNVPINNIIPIYLVFAENHLPKELKDLILTLLYQHLELSYFNIMNY